VGNRTSNPSSWETKPTTGKDFGIFQYDTNTGELELIQDGTGPRGCAISPDGRFMHIAALTSQKILVWAIGEDGTISPTGKNVSQPDPGNVTFFPA
jgi:6-phosphogluconolactonase